MRTLAFLIGTTLLVVDVIKPWHFSVDNNALIAFGFILLLALFDEMEEFNFLGLKGKRIKKELKQKMEEIKQDQQQAVSVNQEQEDGLTKLRKKSVQLMSVDRSNFLALVFEIERLLRLAAVTFYPKDVNDMTPIQKIISLLKENNYLTESGVNQIRELNNVRNLIVHGRVSIEEDPKLMEWTELAYSLYTEIVNSFNNK